METKFNKDSLFVILMILGGGSLIKLSGLQTYYTIFVLLVTFLLTYKDDFKLKEVLRVGLILLVLMSFQLVHSVTQSNYQLLSTQFLRSLLDVLLAYLLSKRFLSRELSFVKNVNYALLIIIIHAIVSVIVVRILGSSNVVFSSGDESVLFRGPNILFAVRNSTDINGYAISSNVLGLGLERAHGIFWEPSVFVNYVAVFLYINIFLRFKIQNIILGLLAMIMAWSSTGLLLSALIVLLFTFLPNSTASKVFKSKLFRLRLGMLTLGVPIIATFFVLNILTFFEDTRKLGSVSQRFYDTAGALFAIRENPIIGSGSNLESYSNALSEDENLYQLKGIAEGIDLNSKDVIKYSNSFLRYLVKYGVPFGLILFYGLWRQQIIRSNSKGVLFVIIAVGTSFSPILELMFFMPFLYSGLIFSKKDI
jgi:hypothetical protein